MTTSLLSITPEQTRFFFSAKGRLERYSEEHQYMLKKHEDVLTPDMQILLQNEVDVTEDKKLDDVNDALSWYGDLDAKGRMTTTDIYNFYQLMVWIDTQIAMLD